MKRQSGPRKKIVASNRLIGGIDGSPFGHFDNSFVVRRHLALHGRSCYEGGTSYPGVLIELKCIRFQGIVSSLDMTIDAAYSDANAN